jgi:hypothetical protein
MRRNIRRDERHPIQPQCKLRGVSRIEMTAVNRIERAAEETDASRAHAAG